MLVSLILFGFSSTSSEFDSYNVIDRIPLCCFFVQFYISLIMFKKTFSLFSSMPCPVFLRLFLFIKKLFAYRARDSLDAKFAAWCLSLAGQLQSSGLYQWRLQRSTENRIHNAKFLWLYESSNNLPEDLRLNCYCISQTEGHVERTRRRPVNKNIIKILLYEDHFI